MTDTLPPGCRKLTFDPNDRGTWKSKLWFNGEKYLPAEIVYIDDEGTPLVILSGLHRISFWSPNGQRLYDAAPEAVKPREWWACWNDAIKQWMSPLAGSPELAEADRRAQWRVVRLIESPEDQT